MHAIFSRRLAPLLSVSLVAFSLPALPQQPATQGATAQPTANGEAVFQRSCAACHTADGLPGATALDARAVPRDALLAFTAEAVVNALTNGKMQVQGSTLSEVERRAVAEFATGKRVGAEGTVVRANLCANPAVPRGALLGNGPGWNGWGNGVANMRLQSGGGSITAADLPRLKLKWAFGYAAVSAARAQPAVAGGRLFVASENGEVHSLDAKTGCTYWTFKAQAGVRTALSIAPYKSTAGRASEAVYFGDSKANVYAVDALSGQQVWTRKVDGHPAASITGAPTVHNGRVFVPVQGLNEEGRGTTNGYQCCTFRGSLNALDANTGAVIWKTYTIDENRPRSKTKDGVQTFGPAGGAIWSSPTVDARRNVVYVATGNTYAEPAQKMANSIVAFDADTGAVKWYRQMLANDTWAMGCQEVNPENPACPAKLGPDFDFSASPALVRNAGGRDLLIVPQKSGLAYALDAGRKGELVWEYRFGKGSGLGGQWGAAMEPPLVYFGTNDLLTGVPGGMHAVNVADGKEVWSQPPPAPLCKKETKGCTIAQGGALTAIPGAVLNGANDGGIRAYSSRDGAIIWSFDTSREFDTVNGVKAKGGSMDGPGPVVAGRMVYVNSGYGGLIGMPGNVLLAFGLD